MSRAKQSTIAPKPEAKSLAERRRAMAVNAPLALAAATSGTEQSQQQGQSTGNASARRSGASAVRSRVPRKKKTPIESKRLSIPKSSFSQLVNEIAQNVQAKQRAESPGRGRGARRKVRKD